eukprot:3010593-Lingulodinium_polyedra.AAC.1
MQWSAPRSSFCVMEKHRLDQPAERYQMRPQQGRAQTLGRSGSSTVWPSGSEGTSGACIQK